jgi:hypothetical protein
LEILGGRIFRVLGCLDKNLQGSPRTFYEAADSCQCVAKHIPFKARSFRVLISALPRCHVVARSLSLLYALVVQTIEIVGAG